jgi:hypothetical protein
MERTCEEAVEHLFDLHALDVTASRQYLLLVREKISTEQWYIRLKSASVISLFNHQDRVLTFCKYAKILKKGLLKIIIKKAHVKKRKKH